jgi:hypothetical protein
MGIKLRTRWALLPVASALVTTSMVLWVLTPAGAVTGAAAQLVGEATGLQHAGAEGVPSLSEDEALAHGRDLAEAALTETIGAKVFVDGRGIRLSDLAVEEFRLVSGAERITTRSGSTSEFRGPGGTARRDVWVVTWHGQAPAPYNGIANADIWVHVMFDDATGTLLSKMVRVHNAEPE